MDSTMKERPILFNAAMVNAILAGNKTQTRRIVKPQPLPTHQWRGWITSSTCAADEGKASWATEKDPLGSDVIRVNCPLGKVGDRLWVRETWNKTRIFQAPDAGEVVVYAACDNRTDYGGPWKPSIHMPRTASRITLEITAVRVERLQDISGNDVNAEGITEDPAILSGDREGSILTTAGKRELYEDLWSSIYGPESWDANHWAWVIEFKRITP
jgi:hypothetical protein